MLRDEFRRMTFNEAIEEVERIVSDLSDRAKADAEASDEAGAKAQAKDDRSRAKALSKACDLIMGAQK
jgi:hypothetical protein